MEVNFITKLQLILSVLQFENAISEIFILFFYHNHEAKSVVNWLMHISILILRLTPPSLLK